MPSPFFNSFMKGFRVGFIKGLYTKPKKGQKLEKNLQKCKKKKSK